MLTLSLQLVLAHFIGDFLFQPNEWVDDKKLKKIKSKYLYYHILVHFALLLAITEFKKQYLIGIVFISISHYVIDCIKLYVENKKTKKTSFFIDQVLHLAIIAIIVNQYQPYIINFEWLYQTKTLALATTLLFTTYVTAIVLKIVLAKWNPNTNNSEEKNNTNKKAGDDETNNAGKYIGILERLFIFFFVVINFWQGIGFLLAAKSIFRFGDLKEKKDVKLTEYILIGTLLSFGIGIMSALIYKNLIK